MSHKPRSVTNKACPYCGVELTGNLLPGGIRPPNAISRDHVVPRCRGGKGVETVRCCKACNHDKDRLSLDEWRAVLSVRRHTLMIFPFERLQIKLIVIDALIRVSEVLSRL
jgi:hypothetical protein